MSYQALYRKFRPSDFSSVKGQDHIVTTLKNQIKSDRIGHAYLFCGTRGTGKTSVAKIMARAVNCQNLKDGNPCGECENCRSILAGTNMNVIEIDAASNNSVDNIREIVEEVTYAPTSGKYKVYIIDEVHMLSIGAFNALLKTLEEPPSYVIFILATTEVHKLPVTILSRCQRYDFRRIDIATITDRMKELLQTEGVNAEDKALNYIAKAADGSLRDALSILDQCIAFHFGKDLTLDMVLDVLGAVDSEVFSRLLRRMNDQDVIGCITLLEEVVMQGRELSQFVSDYTWYLRNLLLVKSCDALEDVLDVSSENLALLKEEAEMIDQNTVMRFIRIFSELSGKLRTTASKRVMIEMAMIKACRPVMEKDATSVLERIRVLEEKIESGAVGMAYPAEGSVPARPAAAPVQKPKLPAAIPEDIKKAVSGWQGILAALDPPTRAYIKRARLSLSSAGDALEIFLPDNSTSDLVIKDDLKKEDIIKVIENFIQKEVKVDFKTYNENEAFENTHIDLKQIINMEITQED